MNRFEIEGPLSHVTKLPMKDETATGARFMVAIPTGRDRRNTVPLVAFDSAATAVLTLGDGATAHVTGRLQRRQYNGIWETSLIAQDVQPVASDGITEADTFPY